MPKLKDIIVITKNRYEHIIAIHKIVFENSIIDNKIQITAKLETITDPSIDNEIIEQKVGD